MKNNIQRAVGPVTKKTRNMIHVTPQGKLSLANASEVMSFSADTPSDSTAAKSANQDEHVETPRSHKCKMIGKHINVISFVVFFILWITVTLGFLLAVAF